MGFSCYNSYMEIDLSILRQNFLSIQSTLPAETEIIPVLKGDAYGFGSTAVAAALSKAANISTIALAQIGEAVELRQAGFQQKLLVLGAFPAEQLPIAVENDLELTVFRPESAKALAEEAEKQNKDISIHIKIETGLNRIGVKPGKDLQALLDTLKTLPRLQLAGVFTHFIDGEIFYSKTAEKQLEIYKEAVSQIESAGFTVPMRHICNSGATDWYPEAYLDAVRVGRRLYMDSRDHPLPQDAKGKVNEVGSWRTSIVNIHPVSVGETVGYDGIFTATRPSVIATICVGYGDGLCTDFVKAGSPVLINGKRARYIGVCMDQSFLDVTDIPCSVGDEVTIFGRASDGAFLSAQELAMTVGHEGVFFTNQLSNRVERRYINK